MGVDKVNHFFSNPYNHSSKNKNSESNSTQVNWFPGHMAKYLSLIEKNISVASVILYLIDSRAPSCCFNPEIDNILQKHPYKKIIYLFTKSDLADQKQTKFWINNLNNNNLHAISVNLKKTNINIEVQNITKKIIILLNDKNSYIYVMGIPNTGKSTLINAISKRKAVKTADKPGITQQIQRIKTTYGFELIDTPGLLWPGNNDSLTSYQLSLIGSIRYNLIPLWETAYYLIEQITLYYPHKLLEFNLSDSLPSKTDIVNIKDYVMKTIINLAQKRGFKKKEEIEFEKIAEYIIHTFRKGKIHGITLNQFEKNNYLV